MANNGPSVVSKILLTIVSLAIVTGATTAAQAALVGAGDIAFIRYNADGADDFAIVLLADADAGQEVHFNNNDYSTRFGQFGSSPQVFTWEIDTALAAGTVVTFADLDIQNGGSVSDGSLRRSDMNADAKTMPISASAETIYAFLGTDQRNPTSFLAAITTEGSSEIEAVGLTPGQTGVVLTSGTHEAHFVGDRDSELMYADYLPAVGDVGANWLVRTANTGTLSPGFDGTDFSLAGDGAGAPESPHIVLLGLAVFLLVGWYERQGKRVLQSE